jgi:hypothetical protein
MHYNPYTNLIQIYETDPAFTYKYQFSIHCFNYGLIAMQVIDNIFVVHKIDDKVSYMYDLKLTDY